MPHIPDLGLKPAAPPVDASAHLRTAHPAMYRFGRRIGWIILLVAIGVCIVLSVAVLTVIAHLYWYLIDAVWRLT